MTLPNTTINSNTTNLANKKDIKTETVSDDMTKFIDNDTALDTALVACENVINNIVIS